MKGKKVKGGGIISSAGLVTKKDMEALRVDIENLRYEMNLKTERLGLQFERLNKNLREFKFLILEGNESEKREYVNNMKRWATKLKEDNEQGNHEGGKKEKTQGLGVRVKGGTGRFNELYAILYESSLKNELIEIRDKMRHGETTGRTEGGKKEKTKKTVPKPAKSTKPNAKK